MASKKINIMIDVDFLAEVDAEAKRQQITRTALINQALSQLLDAKRFLRAKPDIQAEMLKLQDMLADVARSSDPDFQGVLGQTSLFQDPPAKKFKAPPKNRK